MSREDTSIPTASLEDIFLTATIDAYEVRDIMFLDVPNTFIQANMTPNKDGEERVIMKITGVLVDMLVELDSETYRKHATFENGDKVIWVFLLREIYGMLLAALLFYRKFLGKLKNIGFEFNTYDPCVYNRIKVYKQHTVIFHVDNIISSNVYPKVDDKFK